MILRFKSLIDSLNIFDKDINQYGIRDLMNKSLRIRELALFLIPKLQLGNTYFQALLGYRKILTLDYIHKNPVKRGYVDLPEHWRYSSARAYMGMESLVLLFC